MKEVREERRVVTALFADVVGSTSLVERLDPEEAKLIVGEAIARAIAAVEHYGGTIKDIAGDGLLALFGAPVTHEDDPERAIRAGWEIVTAADEYAAEVRRGWGIEDFAIRVAVHTGEAVLGPVGAGGRVEYGAVGDSVNTAARLQGAAQPGVVLVSDSTQRLVAPLFQWGEAVTLQLKGKADPMLAYPLKGLGTAGQKFRGLAAAPTPLVGRGPELEVASAALADLAGGRGGVLFIVGDAGIGKSRMIGEMRNLAAGGNTAYQWLRGRCVSYGESLPYWPYRALVREWLGLGDQDPELRARVALRRRIEQLFPDRVLEVYPYLAVMLGLNVEADAGARIRQLSPESLQFRTFEVVRELIGRLAADQPVVLGIDDLHWADSTSVQLTEKLVQLSESAAVLLVLGQRPERDHASWALKEKSARDYPHLFAELNLRTLGSGAGKELLHSLVGPSLPAALEDRICSYADGNPFYLEEIVRSLIDRGELIRDGDGWRLVGDVEVQIPNTIEGVILARIDRLKPAWHEVITAAAVLGRNFTVSLLGAVVQEDGTQLGEALHELQRLELIREQSRKPEPEYRFKHALIQEAAYNTLVSARRKALHQRAAIWLEDRHRNHREEVYGLLAYHWRAAEEDAKAINYLRLAGDKARDEYSLDEAIGHYRELLPLLERGERREEAAETLFKLALALHTAMRYEAAATIYERAFDAWQGTSGSGHPATATLKMATTYVPNDPDPTSAIAWANIQLCMQLGDRLTEAWPNRNIVPSLAERWEIAPDGLRYVFHLRHGLTWNDGSPLTASDFVNGIRRVLNPDAPGSSVSIYFVIENAREYYLREHADVERIGVHALDPRTLEFRLAAPAPYFMSVLNRPDAGPQRAPDDRRCGPFSIESRTPERLVLVRDPGYTAPRSGNVRRVEFEYSQVDEALAKFERNEVDLVPMRYAPGFYDMAATAKDAQLGAASWSGFLTFNCNHPVGGDVELRRALAYAIDREALARTLPVNLMIATGGLVPPAVQGHTPDIAPRFEPDRARAHLERSGFTGVLEVAAVSGVSMQGDSILPPIFESWREVLGIEPRVRVLEAPLGSTRPFGIDTPLAVMGWLPGYPDPEYYLRLLLHSDALTNKGQWAHPPFDDLVERAGQDRTGPGRLALFHEADRMAVQDQCALIPLIYGRVMVFVKPWVHGWWEWGKSCSSFADVWVDETSPRFR